MTAVWLPSIMTDNREARCYLLHFDDVSSVGEEDFSLFVMQCYPFEDPTTTLQPMDTPGQMKDEW